MRQKLIPFLVFFSCLFFISPAQQLHAHWTQSIKKISDCEYDLIFTVKIDPTWHMFSMVVQGEDGPNPTSIKFIKSSDYELLGKIKESAPIEEMDKVFEMKVAFFIGTASFTQKIKLKSDKKISISGKYEYQVCTDEKCEFPPAEKFVFDLPSGSSACVGEQIKDTTLSRKSNAFAVIETEQSTTLTKVDTAAILKIKGCATNDVSNTNVQTTQLQGTTTATRTHEEVVGSCNPWHTFLAGLGWGFAAMLMPCIYSLIPLTVSFFLKRSKSRRQGIRDAVIYGLCIIFIFDVITMLIPIIAGPAALNNISTNTGVNLFFFLLFVVFALSFFGLFEITLPSSWGNKLDARADKGGVMGIFFMAMTLVVVSFSCTGLFLGNLIHDVSGGGSYICPLTGFTGFGLGIALPFMFFAFFPSMLKSLPKAGGWMTTFKVTIAFVELALAVKFLANADNVNEWGFITREVFLSLWIGIFAMLTFYLLGVFRTSHDAAPGPIGVGRILWATFFMSFTFYLIPGLWGAPLKLISSFPPPHHYAESPDGVGYHGEVAYLASNSSVAGNSEIADLEKLRVSGPEGLKIFKNDYESALKYSKLVNKPLFIDFTGNACVNCRLMESTVWVTKPVLSLLKEKVVIVSLYVDSKVSLPPQEQKEVFWYGRNRKLESIGDKYAFLQTTKYNSSSQPQYVLLNLNETIVSKGTIGTEKDEKVFAFWLQEGIDNFNRK